MKKLLGYAIFAGMAGTVQAAIIRSAMRPGPENYMPLVFEGVIALFAFAMWCVAS